jgi:hypothetical protein
MILTQVFKEPTDKYYMTLIRGAYMRLILILIAFSLAACAEDKTVYLPPLDYNSLMCTDYEIGTWEFNGVEEKSNFADCGKVDGYTIIRIKSITDEPLSDFIEIESNGYRPCGGLGAYSCAVY